VNQLVVLPLWQWLAMIAILVAVVAPAVGIPSAIFGYKRGARQAIAICSEHWECAMVQNAKRKSDTQNMRDQLEALHKAHPEILSARAAMQQALKDTDPNLPVIPEEKGKTP
jgi:hypothetical protein